MSLAATLLERFRPAISHPAAMPLAAALAKLDIEPFDRFTVADYQAKKKAEAMRAALPINPAYTWVEHDPARLYFLGSPSVVDPVGVFVNPAFTHERDYRQREGWDARLFVEDRYGLVYMVYARWQRSSLSDQSVQALVKRHVIPEFVARKVEQVERLVPNVQIEIDTLETTTRDCDPFLVVRLGREEYYIEVWGDDEGYNR